MAKPTNNGVHGDNAETFEQSFLRLQEVVQKLSEGNLTLQQALAAFEEGMPLADSCGRMLEEAELRVKQVSDRAADAGAASVLDMHEAMRLVPAEAAEEEGEAEVLSFEIETYESLVFDKPKRSASPAKERESKIQTPASGYPKSKIQPLEPLFDEDD